MSFALELFLNAPVTDLAMLAGKLEQLWNIRLRQITDQDAPRYRFSALGLFIDVYGGPHPYVDDSLLSFSDFGYVIAVEANARTEDDHWVTRVYVVGYYLFSLITERFGWDCMLVFDLQELLLKTPYTPTLDPLGPDEIPPRSRRLYFRPDVPSLTAVVDVCNAGIWVTPPFERLPQSHPPIYRFISIGVIFELTNNPDPNASDYPYVLSITVDPQTQDGIWVDLLRATAQFFCSYWAQVYHWATLFCDDVGTVLRHEATELPGEP